MSFLAAVLRMSNSKKKLSTQHHSNSTGAPWGKTPVPYKNLLKEKETMKQSTLGLLKYLEIEQIQQSMKMCLDSTVKLADDEKKKYVFNNNNIWILQCTSVRHSFPNDPANPSASLLTRTRQSEVQSLLGKDNNFAVTKFILLWVSWIQGTKKWKWDSTSTTFEGIMKPAEPPQDLSLQKLLSKVSRC